MFGLMTDATCGDACWKVNTASPSAVKAWPELAAWRGARSRPLVAWVREDMAHLVQDAN